MRSLKVLVCEDDPLQAMTLEDILYEAGHRPVGPAASYVQALEIADGTVLDAAIVDLTLADGRSGPMIARHLEERGIRVIVLSGLAEVDPDLSAIQHVYLTKPARAEILERLLRPRGPVTVAA